MIHVYDDVLDYETCLHMHNRIIEDMKTWGKPGQDLEGDPSVGTSSVLSLDSPEIIPIKEKIYNLEPALNPKHNLYFNYVNQTHLYEAGSNPYYHFDLKQKNITCLFYVNPHTIPNDLGSTDFLIDDEIRGILPKPGRLVVFDGRLWHRASSFRDKPRTVLAIKFKARSND